MSASAQAYANAVVSDFRNEANVTPDQGTLSYPVIGQMGGP